LVRTGESLKKAVDQIQQWSQKLSAAPCNRPGLETRNMAQVGQCIAEAALWRANSVGAHFREDFPFYKGLEWKTHSRCQQDVSHESVVRIRKKSKKHLSALNQIEA
jgi:L-aspartate oxidase